MQLLYLLTNWLVLRDADGNVFGRRAQRLFFAPCPLHLWQQLMLHGWMLGFRLKCFLCCAIKPFLTFFPFTFIRVNQSLSELHLTAINFLSFFWGFQMSLKCGSFTSRRHCSLPRALYVLHCIFSHCIRPKSAFINIALTCLWHFLIINLKRD